jgi:hypothetical protein
VNIFRNIIRHHNEELEEKKGQNMKEKEEKN